MTVLGFDDTDSRTGGMCTTWIASEVARRLPTGAVQDAFLIRLHPAIEHKTRGNGAVALRTSEPPARASELAGEVIDEYAVCDDPDTNPGLVAIQDARKDSLRTFARAAVRRQLTRESARDTLAEVDAEIRGWGNGRGLIGATAAIGAVGAHAAGDPRDPVFADWTYEMIAYRESERWGTDRAVELPNQLPPGPAVWDTRDPVSGEPVCIPRSPCPVLLGIRGDSSDGIRRAARTMDGEPVERAQMFITNQGTDAHLRPGRIGAFEEGHGYWVKGTVSAAPETREGGHVSVRVRENGDACECLAFAPTGRFRDRVRSLRVGDTIIACGEVGTGAIKLEKFAVVHRALTTETTPRCPECDRSMKSAGRGQGYRCRRCDTQAEGKTRTSAARQLERGWYEVPPGARRHIAKPLIRGAYDLPAHPTSG